jgi:segregation and condensation protein B
MLLGRSGRRYSKPMASDQPPQPRDTPAQSLGLEAFRSTPPHEGISLDQLNQAFAAMLGAGDDPYSTPPDPDADPLLAEAQAADSEGVAVDASGPCEVTPRTIVEAVLFVGLPDNRPLTSQQIAALMRGVRPDEVDDLVCELNAGYAAAGCPYRIISQGAGYRMALRDEFLAVRDRFYGRVRQARLSPAAIEVLAIVAYNETATAEEIAALRGTPSGAVLAQLVRRQLLVIQRDPANPKAIRYRTTARFLEVFGIRSLAELPQSQELEWNQ